MTLLSDLFEPPRAHVLRWAGAAAFVLAAHIGCTALALMHWQEDTSDDAAAGPVIVEMVPAPAVSRVDSPDVAHGPLMEEATLSPQPAKETKEEVEKETPPVDPSPLAPEPEVVLPVARPIPEKKPEEEPPNEEVPKQQSADQTTAAPLTTAPPRVDAPEPTPRRCPHARCLGQRSPRSGQLGKGARETPQPVQALSRHRACPRQPRGRDRAIHGRPDRTRHRRARSAELGVIYTRRGGSCRLEAGRPAPGGAGPDCRNDIRSDVAHSISDQMRQLQLPKMSNPPPRYRPPRDGPA